MRDFLAEFIETKPGEIRELETNELLGHHDGAIFYTIGQRHGLGLTTGLPFYVVRKDMDKNTVYVSRNLNSLSLWTNEVKLRDVILRRDIDDSKPLRARVRHRAPLVDAKFDSATDILTFADEQKSLTPGQSVVFYQDDICLGGGIIA